MKMPQIALIATVCWIAPGEPSHARFTCCALQDEDLGSCAGHWPSQVARLLSSQSYVYGYESSGSYPNPEPHCTVFYYVGGQVAFQQFIEQCTRHEGVRYALILHRSTTSAPKTSANLLNRLGVVPPRRYDWRVEIRHAQLDSYDDSIDGFAVLRNVPDRMSVGIHLFVSDPHQLEELQIPLHVVVKSDGTFIDFVERQRTRQR